MLGTHLSSIQHKLLYDLPKVAVMMDGDKAGREAARVISVQLPNTVAVHLPDGLDPDDLSDQELAGLSNSILL